MQGVRAIELVLDEESQNKLNNLRKLLDDNGVHNEAVPTNHVSIADVETEDIDNLKRIVNEFASETNKFDITLCIAESFMTSENVLFYSPTMTEDLLKSNEKISEKLRLNNFECNKYYTKNNWLPHCTLAIRLSDDELKKGLELLKDNNILPLRVRCEKVDILDYSNKPNYNQVAIYDLN